MKKIIFFVFFLLVSCSIDLHAYRSYHYGNKCPHLKNFKSNDYYTYRFKRPLMAKAFFVQIKKGEIKAWKEIRHENIKSRSSNNSFTRNRLSSIRGRQSSSIKTSQVFHFNLNDQTIKNNCSYFFVIVSGCIYNGYNNKKTLLKNLFTNEKRGRTINERFKKLKTSSLAPNPYAIIVEFGSEEVPEPFCCGCFG